MSVQRRPVHRLVAHVASPCGVPAAAPRQDLVTDEDPVRAEGVPIEAAPRRMGHPRSGGRGCTGRLARLTAYELAPVLLRLLTRLPGGLIALRALRGP